MIQITQTEFEKRWSGDGTSADSVELAVRLQDEDLTLSEEMLEAAVAKTKRSRMKDSPGFLQLLFEEGIS